MKISLIAAMARNYVIGVDNKMPWHLPADLAHFKKITTGKAIIMGRKTFDSIGRPLPNRQNIVITRQENWQHPGVQVFHSLDQAINELDDQPEVMIIGGGNIYAQAIAKADRLYLTYIDLHCEGDAFFPEINAEQWRELSRDSHQPDKKNPYNYCFVELQRRSS